MPGYEKGNFVGPTILAEVTPSMTCYSEEIFGPVLVALNADNLDEVCCVCYSTVYGLCFVCIRMWVLLHGIIMASSINYS